MHLCGVLFSEQPEVVIRLVNGYTGAYPQEKAPVNTYAPFIGLWTFRSRERTCGHFVLGTKLPSNYFRSLEQTECRKKLYVIN